MKIESVTILKYSIIITLTPREAFVLREVMGRIGGLGSGPAGFTKNLYAGLREMGLKPIEFCAEGQLDISGEKP